jgi:asparagine synthase (glutamine-hydrolysing)
LRRTFDEAVRLRMIADVPLGAFLSGGIDSSLVVASMARQSSEPVKTFSVGFAESGVNELPFAAMVAQQYGTEHHEILVRPDSLDLVNRIVRHFDEPFGDTASIPTFIMSEFARRHVKVCLTGDGGDELFGGYESFFKVEKLRWADSIPQLARRAIAQVAEALPYSAYGKNYLRMLSRSSALDRYFEMNTAHYFMRKRLLQPDWMLPADAAFFAGTLSDCLVSGPADVLTQAMYFEATAKLTGDMLVKVDRMSMANSLEVRCPMLDSELAELACRIPHCWKIRNGSGKRILIEAMGERLPPALLNRPKMGFGFPLPDWFRGPLRDFLWDHLTAPSFLNRNIVSGPFVKHLLAEHQSGRRNHAHWLAMLLMFELWLREFEAGVGARDCVPAEVGSC